MSSSLGAGSILEFGNGIKVEKSKNFSVGMSAMIINASMIIALITFCVIAVFLRPPNREGGELPVVTLTSVGFSIAAIIGSFIVTSRSRQRTVAQVANQKLEIAKPSGFTNFQSVLASRYLIGMLMGLALLEGAAIFSVAAYLIEGHWLALSLFALIVTIMAATFSTPTKVELWIERVKQDAKDMREFST